MAGIWSRSMPFKIIITTRGQIMNSTLQIVPFRKKRAGFKYIAALILIGCSGGVMPRSTNKIARIPFQGRFLAGFLLWSLAGLLSLHFHIFIAKLFFYSFLIILLSYQVFWKLTFLFSNKIKYSSVLISIKSDWSILRFMSIQVLAFVDSDCLKNR